MFTSEMPRMVGMKLGASLDLRAETGRYRSQQARAARTDPDGGNLTREQWVYARARKLLMEAHAADPHVDNTAEKQRALLARLTGQAEIEWDNYKRKHTPSITRGTRPDVRYTRGALADTRAGKEAAAATAEAEAKKVADQERKAKNKRDKAEADAKARISADVGPRVAADALPPGVELAPDPGPPGLPGWVLPAAAVVVVVLLFRGA